MAETSLSYSQEPPESFHCQECEGCEFVAATGFECSMRDPHFCDYHARLQDPSIP